MAANGMKRYTGRIGSVHRNDGGAFAWISRASILTEEGAPVTDLGKEDVFLHSDDCAVPLTVGTVVSFSVIEDRKRSNCWRANGAMELVEPEALPAGDPLLSHMHSLMRTNQGECAIAPPITGHPWRSRMKDVPHETVAQVTENDPLPQQPRDESSILSVDDPKVLAALEQYLREEFPQLAGLDLGYGIAGVDEEAFTAKAKAVVEDLRGMGMGLQAQRTEEEIRRFTGVRNVLGYLWTKQLVRPNTFIPIRYLPDLFMACPVWYHAMKNPRDAERAIGAMDSSDPGSVSNATQFFCNLFPENDRWAHTFQMFNRRYRPIQAYSGDMIPIHLLRLIQEALPQFDHLVIATPYLAEAGRDWRTIRWIRSVDPYVLGFQGSCKHFFVLGRFSDSGVFPLFPELLGDTIEFLRTNKELLRNFNSGNGMPPWCVPSTQRLWYHNVQLGNDLLEHANQLLAAFDAGHLFDWIRGEWELPPAALQTDVKTP
ncbi:hypothetical protein HYV74_00680 [Candidatus Uhrbacteria bacterium]|nr:hypothetical protein [Candidatus Uhrbacteria bacterium]